MRVYISVYIYIHIIQPRAPSYPNSRLLDFVTLGYVETSLHYLGNWEA